MTDRIKVTTAGKTSALTRRGMLTGATALAVAAQLGRPRAARAGNYKFGVALGWTACESGRHIQNGYMNAIAKLGGTATVADASINPKKQSKQVDAMVATTPDAIFISPVYAVTAETLAQGTTEHYDTYDQPGQDKVLGWTRVL
jgi:ribose transport system substrate-binding protein